MQHWGTSLTTKLNSLWFDLEKLQLNSISCRIFTWLRPQITLSSLKITILKAVRITLLFLIITIEWNIIIFSFVYTHSLGFIEKWNTHKHITIMVYKIITTKNINIKIYILRAMFYKFDCIYIFYVSYFVAYVFYTEHKFEICSRYLVFLTAFPAIFIKFHQNVYFSF